MPLKPREIWEKGTPLNEAWLRFSDSKLREQFNDPGDYQKTQALDFDKEFLDSPTAVIGHIYTLLRSPKIRETALLEMQSKLKAALSKGELLAFGFPTWPAEARIPRLLQSHFWINAEVNWLKEIAGDESNQYQKIRVVNPKDFPGINLKPIIGRKSYLPEISWAIVEAEKLNPSFQELPNKAKTAEIRHLIKLNSPGINPEGPGLGDDAIRKHISRYYSERDKEN